MSRIFKCPECGETNYAEEWKFWVSLGHSVWIKTFDCKYEEAFWVNGTIENTARKAACGRAEKKRKDSDESNGFRLALYDAANMVEGLANAMREGKLREKLEENEDEDSVEQLDRYIVSANFFAAEMRRFAQGKTTYVPKDAAPSGSPNPPAISMLENIKKRFKID